MGIQKTKQKDLFWNYYLSLVDELKVISNYIELDPDNYKTYSIELAKLFMSASSEVDVVMKKLCDFLDKNKKHRDIAAYRKTIKKFIPDVFANEKVQIRRHGLELQPWINWAEEGGKNPLWWMAYNSVKHQRSEHFNQATLHNTLNSVAALFITIIYLRAVEFLNPHPPGYTKVEIESAIHYVSNFGLLNEQFFNIKNSWRDDD